MATKPKFSYKDKSLGQYFDEYKVSEKTKTRLYTTPISTKDIGKMTAAELQNNIETYAKRLNQRIADIKRYDAAMGIDFSGMEIALQRELGAQKASRGKLRGETEQERIDNGRYRLRKILEVYTKYPRLTRTGQRAYYTRKQREYSQLLGIPLTMQQTIRFNELTQGLTEVAFDSDLLELLDGNDPITDAFDGDVDAFIDWLTEKRNAGEDLVAAYENEIADLEGV